jgi:uncharacterized protein
MRFTREIEIELLKWKKEKKRKPLLILGARQIGKSEVLHHFATHEFSKFIHINFEEQEDLKELFETSIDVLKIVEQLSYISGVDIDENTLLIFDEIQECRAALTSLKYFHEKLSHLPIACAGSLLGVAITKDKRGFPVGKVEFLNMFPLTFKEYLQQSAPSLYKFYTSWMDDLSWDLVPSVFHNGLIEQLKYYFISGGLPEVAATMIETKNMIEVGKTLQNLLNAYRFDFSKYTETKDVPRIHHIYNSIPSQLSRENKKFLYGVAKEGARAREYESALLWLEQSNMVQKIYRISKPSLPLNAYDDLNAFKLYICDVGILGKLSNINAGMFINGHQLFTEFKGAFTENYIASSLRFQYDNNIRYWSSEGRAEIDFVIQHNNDVIPIEVKADENTKSKSLSVYEEKFSPKFKIRFSLKNCSQNGNIINLPLYFADGLHSFLDRML